jgi:hypothetical protein
MASGVAQYGANFCLGCFLGLITPPSQFWIGLVTADPGPIADGDIVSALEPSDPNYHRVSYATGSSNWALNNGLSTNIHEIDFPLPLQDWGFITHYVMLDAEHGGNLYGYGILANPQRVTVGYAMGLPPGGIALIQTSLQNSIAT